MAPYLLMLSINSVIFYHSPKHCL